MPEITIPLVVALAMGLLLGGLTYPFARLAQFISGKVVSQGAWLHMLLTMLLWGIAMAAPVALFTLLLDADVRRAHLPWWGVGFCLGVPIGNLLSHRFTSSE